MEIYKQYIEEYKDFPIKGINYLDLNPLYLQSQLRNKLVQDCIDSIKEFEFDYIGAVESRGYMIGSILSHELNKGLLLLRSKPNRLPGKTSVVKHKLEYGESQMEVQRRSNWNGTGKVLIIDDVLATGGTAKGAIEVLNKGGYDPIGALFLVELDFLNASLSVSHKSIIHYE